MTIEDILDLITGDEWYLDYGGCLCSSDNDDCPLWYAYRHLDPDEDGDCEDYIEAGVRCGLSNEDAIAIANAADNCGDPLLRARLLATVGLC